MAGLILCFNNDLFAKNFGIIGPVYEIEEVDLLDWIQKKLTGMEKDGKLKKLQADFIDTAREHVLRPTPVEGLSRTTEYRKFMYDPSIILSRNIADNSGNIIYKRGQRINPLSRVSLHSTLLFFNSDDELQVKFVRSLDHDLIKKTKLILVRGSIIEQSKIWNRNIYFDQKGALVRKLGIKHIPAMVKQQGLFLQVEEIKP